MKKHVFWMLAMTLIPACAFAVDGVVLINQSTVMAAGGFPYTISAPGSYRLSGNLAATGTQAIIIAADFVVLDLNGFNVACTGAPAPPATPINCIGEATTYFHAVYHVSIRNGTVTATAGPNFNAAIGFSFISRFTLLEELHIQMVGTGGGLPTLVVLGPWSIMRHNILEQPGTTSSAMVLCPSLILENILIGIPAFSTPGFGCALANNTQ